MSTALISLMMHSFFVNTKMVCWKFLGRQLNSLSGTLSRRLIGKNLHFCGINIEENELLEEASKLNCKASHVPFSYLGLPLGGHPKQASFWQPVIDKIQWKLEKWKRYNLSREGRATLCKSVLSHTPTYYISIFAMSAKVSQSVERLLRNFF